MLVYGAGAPLRCCARRRTGRSVVWQLPRISCSSLHRQQDNPQLSGESICTTPAAVTALSGLLFLACLGHPPGGDGYCAPEVQRQRRPQAAHQKVVSAIVTAFTKGFVDVMVANAVLAWHALMVSGIADMKVPLRYVVDCQGHKLDCAFEIPLIGGNQDDDQAGLAVAKLAALQVRSLQWCTPLRNNAHIPSVFNVDSFCPVGPCVCRYFTYGSTSPGTAYCAGTTSWSS